MSSQSLPVSAIVKAKNVEEPKKKTREDWRKAKELEEARKAGTAPAAVDEEGKDINPHIPQYIAQAPWYFGAAGPTLKHQRPQPEKEKEFSTLNDWYNRGVQNLTATRYRNGACENCGALGHQKKECMERPRKIGARFTGNDIAPDEFSQPDLALDYDGKRDRWNGYNPDEHRTIVEEFAKIEEAKRQLKSEKLKQDLMSGEGGNDINKDVDSDANEDEDKYVDDIDMPGTKVDSKQRITVRNLRIREDTAKYLRNLDPNSAYYDPKTRSMRDNPYKKTGKNPEEVQFAGDNFVRYTGDTQRHATAQLFAWEAYEKGVDVHLLAEPTKLELLNREFEKRKDHFKETVKDSILDKYGGAEHLDVPQKEILLGQTEQYIEFSRHGKIIKGMEKAIVRSKFQEDVFINNHMCVWGSYWKDGYWGYQCCHSFVKNSYCTGEAGKTVTEDQREMNEISNTSLVPVFEAGESSKEEEELVKNTVKVVQEEKLSKKKKKKRDKKRKQRELMRKKRAQKKKVESSESSASASSDDDEEQEDKAAKERKLRLALLMEEENKRQADRILAMDERKRPYNSMMEIQEPTQEEMEAYYMKKRREDDPMADFLGK